MKKVEIRKFTHAEVEDENAAFGFVKIPERHELIRAEGEDLEVSDGYHTFDELYDHRIALYIALCRQLRADPQRLFYVWKSKLHANGSGYDGWFILGINTKPGTQISYHLPESMWDQCDFAVELERAPEWDGHTSADVLERLKTL